MQLIISFSGSNVPTGGKREKLEDIKAKFESYHKEDCTRYL
jgi:hypothetical protein